jgi:DNA damage-binding protein 1
VLTIQCCRVACLVRPDTLLQEASRKFLLLSIRIVVQPSGEEVEVNNISLIDDQTFESIYLSSSISPYLSLSFFGYKFRGGSRLIGAALQQISLEGNEVGSAVTSMTFADDPTPYFVVGTAFVDPNEPEPSRGRILLYRCASFLYKCLTNIARMADRVRSVSEGRLVLVAEKEVKGCPYSVTPFGGRLATGINSKIQIWRLVSQEDGSKDLQVRATAV